MGNGAEVIEKTSCPECPSSDAYAIYDDGSTYCYSCTYFIPPNNSGHVIKGDVNRMESKVKFIDNGTYRDLSDRAIKASTCEFWKYQVGKAFNKETGQNEVCHIANFYENGSLVGQKLRFANKHFTILGKLPKLYGQWLWKHGGLKAIITTGELDALAMSQANNNKWCVMSVTNGDQSAKKALQENREWLEDKFKEIVLLFDNDEPGQKAAKECYKIFTPGTCKIAELPEKDASDMVQTGKVSELISAVFNATKLRSEGLLTIKDIRPRLSQKPEWGLDYPWETLTKLTYGIGKPELAVWTAPTGKGKTSFMKSIIIDLIRKGKKAGIVFLEETPEETVTSLAGYFAETRFDMPDIQFSDEDKDRALDELENRNSIIINDISGENDWKRISSKIREMIVVEECDFIVLDHITKFTDRADEGQANRIAETIMSELSDMVMELNAHIAVISHTRKTSGSAKSFEEGARIGIDDMKGSSAIKQYAWHIFGLNPYCEEDDSTVRVLEILKSRKAGWNVGKTLMLKYFPETNIIKEWNADFEKLSNLEDIV